MQTYAVELDWVGRRVADLPRRTRGRLGWKRRRKGDRDKDPNWLDAFDVPFDVDGLLVMLTVIVVIVLGFVFWELFVGAVVLFLLEAVVLVPLAILALLWRTLLRRPWRVVVRTADGAEVRHVDVVGWRRARRLRDSMRSQLSAGATPADLHLEGVN